jgi:O-antigen/teichoic acid export membrane protein
MSYIHRVKRSLFFVLLFTVVGGLAAIALRSLLAKQLSPAEYGLFYAVYAFVFLIYSFRDLGTGAALSAFIPEWLVKKKHNEVSSGLWSVMYIQGMYIAVVGILLIVFRKYVAESIFNDPKAIVLIMLLIVFLVFESVLSALTQTFIGMQANGISMSINAVKLVLVIVFSAVLLRAGYGVTSPAWAYLVATVLLIPLYFYILKNKVFQELQGPSVDKQVMFRLISYGKHFVLTGIGGLILSSTDSIMLTVFSGVLAVGIYNAALPLINLIISVGALFLMILIPLAAEIHANKQTHVLVKGMEIVYKYFFLLAGPFIAVLMVFPEEIITLFFGSAYISAANPMRILAIGAVAYVFSSFNYGVLAGIGRADVQSKALIVIASINVLLNFLLIPQYGVAGAAIATSIAYGIGLVISVVATRSVLQTKIPWSSWVKSGAILAVSIYLTLQMKAVTQLPLFVELIVMSAGIFILYFALCWLIGIIRKEEIQEIKSMMKR